MKIVILAAGVASRLRPLTDHTPKCLLKAGKKSILEMAIDNIVSTVDNPEIIIVTGYLESKIREFVGKRFPHLSVTYINNYLYTSTNNIYSLWMVKDLVEGDDMIMMDSDIVFDRSILSKLVNSGYKSCLALKCHELSDEEIKVKTDDKGRVLAISKEVDPAEAAGESIGIELFRGEMVYELFRLLEKKVVSEKKVNIYYEAAFEELTDLYTVDTTEFFCMEIDTPDDLVAAKELVLNHYDQSRIL